jgi:hypothetical protein
LPVLSGPPHQWQTWAPHKRNVKAQTGHRSERMVRRYIRNGNLFRSNASGVVGYGLRTERKSGR